VGKILFDDKDQPILRPCDYSCNRKRGIYDHTFVGFGPVSDPKYMIIVKLSEPNPGRIKNFSSATVGNPFAQMMSFTLNYYRVAKDY
jgi:cell division protein FtsI/penicillin-binding protein 2